MFPFIHASFSLGPEWTSPPEIQLVLWVSLSCSGLATAHITACLPDFSASLIWNSDSVSCLPIRTQSFPLRFSVLTIGCWMFWAPCFALCCTSMVGPRSKVTHLFIFCFYFLSNSTPNMGLKLRTPRSIVACSTNKASQVPQSHFL